MCFKAGVSGTTRFSAAGPLTLLTFPLEFDETTITKPHSLCVPVARDGRAPIDAATDLVEYSIHIPEKQSKNLNVAVLDSFGPRWVDLSNFEIYSVPSLANPPAPPSAPPYSTDNVDRFVCAKATQNKGAGAFPRTLTTTITDQLTQQTRVMSL